MAHVLKEKFHSYLMDTNDTGSVAEIQQDGADHVMDLRNMSDNGVLNNGTHNGNVLKGKAVPVGSVSFFVTLDEYESGQITRRYEGFLVRDKTFGPFNIKLLAGRFIVLHNAKFSREVGPVLAQQEEGGWVATKP